MAERKDVENVYKKPMLFFFMHGFPPANQPDQVSQGPDLNVSVLTIGFRAAL